MAEQKKPGQAQPKILIPPPPPPRLAQSFMRDRWRRLVEAESEARRARVWCERCGDHLNPRYASALAIIRGAIMDKSAQIISLKKFSGVMRERDVHAAALLRDLDAEDLVEVRQTESDEFEVRLPLERLTPPTAHELARIEREAIAAQNERAIYRRRKGRGR